MKKDTSFPEEPPPPEVDIRRAVTITLALFIVGVLLLTIISAVMG